MHTILNYFLVVSCSWLTFIVIIVVMVDFGRKKKQKLEIILNVLEMNLLPLMWNNEEKFEKNFESGFLMDVRLVGGLKAGFRN